MCTLAIAFRVFPETPIVVAANRDEVLDRPSTPPRKRDGSPAIIAPRDEEAGGTWIGINEYGLLVAITNRWVDADLEGMRSRGLLVNDALGQPDVDTAASLVEAALQDDAYEGFNLLLADPDTAVVFEWDGRLRVTSLDPGLHVVMNTGVDDNLEMPASRPDLGKQQIRGKENVREALDPALEETATAWLDRAAAVLGDHDVGVCVHRDGFGTRSASLVAFAGDGTATYRFADGPPCETPFRVVNEQF